MFKNVFMLIFLSLSFLQISCSSNSSGDGDLDISEIQKIESTGEFSEDEFFSDEELVAETKDAELIEVPGDDIAAGIESGDLEDVGSELDLEIVEDGGADLLADADLDIANEFEDGGEEIQTDLAEDNGELNFDDLDSDSGDLAFDDAEDAVSASDDLLLEEDGTDFSEFEDAAAVDPGASSENVTINVEEFDDVVAGDISTEEQPASDLLEAEDVSVADSDFSTEDVSVSNDFADFDDEPQVNENTSSSDLLAGEDISVDSSFDDVSVDDNFGSSDINNSIALEDTTAAEFTDSVEPVKTFIPVKKMKTVPFEKNGILANSIYFVRSGDSLSGIANKIYGSGSAVDFTIVNPHLNPGSLRVGQKVYYNSPRRPQDRSRLITFYEDSGTPAQYYQASEGENIRKISKDLLGHSRSWMEVWASNQDIVSKGSLDSSYSVRYWMGNDVSAPAVLASNRPVESTPPPAPVANTNTNPRVNDTRSSLEAEIEIDQRIEENQAPQVAKEEINNFDNEPDFSEPDLDPPAPTVAKKPAPVRPAASGRINDINNNRPGINNDNTINTANNDDFNSGGGDDEIDFTNDDLVEDTNDGFDDVAQNANPESPREIAKRPNFPIAKRTGALSKSMIESLALGVGGLLLLIAVLLIIRKKRKRAEAIQMDSFDFGGETTIENEQTKTQIDI